MHPETRKVYEFGGFRLDPVRRLLSRLDGQTVALTPKLFDTLSYLVEHSGHLVEKKELLDAVWPNVIVEEHNLNKSISMLRRALDVHPGSHEYIATIPGRGYQFVCEVQTSTGSSISPESFQPHPPQDGPSVSLPATSPAAIAPPAPPVPALRLASALRSHTRLTLVAAAVATAVGLAVGLAWAAWLGREREPRSEPVNRFAHVLPGDRSLRGYGRNVIALAPNGRHFVFNTDGGLYLRRMDEIEAHVIPGTEQVVAGPFFSPDGLSVAYYVAAEGRIERRAIDGGNVVVIASGVENPVGARWEADGTILFGQTKGIFRVPAGGGVPVLVIEARAGETLSSPELLPGGERVLFSARSNAASWDQASVVAAVLNTGERTVVIDGASDAHYDGSGTLLFARGEELFGVGFDAATLQLIGAAVPIARGAFRAAVTASANYAVADDGTLIYLHSGNQAVHTLVWVDREGREEPLPLGALRAHHPRLSPDGNRLAVTLDSGSNEDVWVYDLQRNTKLSRVTVDPNVDWRPVWMPDGASVVYGSFRDGGGLFQRAADGTGSEQRLTTSADGTTEVPELVTADGNIVLRVEKGDFELDLYELSSADRTVRPLFAEQDGHHAFAALSPDGRWLAYTSDETGPLEVYVRRYPSGQEKRKISVDGGAEALWAPNGSEIVYRNGDAVMAVGVSTEPTFEAGVPRTLFTGSYWSSFADLPTYDIHPSGLRFLMMKDEAESGSAAQLSVVVIQNWRQDVERLRATQ